MVVSSRSLSRQSLVAGDDVLIQPHNKNVQCKKYATAMQMCSASAVFWAEVENVALMRQLIGWLKTRLVSAFPAIRLARSHKRKTPPGGGVFKHGINASLA
jgi:hypothetical protein